MGLLDSYFHNSDDWDDSDDDNDSIGATPDVGPIIWPESLFAEIGKMSRGWQQDWEDRNRSSSIKSSRESIPDTGWTRTSFIEYVGGPIKIEREGYCDVVTVFRPGDPMWSGRGWPIHVPQNRRATSAQWCNGELHIQLSNGRVYVCHDPYNGTEF